MVTTASSGVGWLEIDDATDVRDDLRAVDRLLAVPVAQVAHDDVARLDLVGADDQDESGAGPVGRLHLRLHRARRAGLGLEGAVGAQPGARSSSVRSRAPSPPAMSTTNTSSARSGAPNTPSASQVASTRSMPEPKPMPGVGGPPSDSTRPS